jgi:flavorubredoxin
MEISIRFLPTQTLAPETFLIRQIGGEGTAPELIHLNSMVIRGAEPVIIDTGVELTSEAWQEEVFAVVEPEDVRWIFLSHDDTDHTGSLHTVLERCPQATLVTNWFSVERMSIEGVLPLERLRMINPGESFQAGPRTLTAIVPPTFDSPTTRGLYDASTGVYWAADSFGLGVPEAIDDISELPAGYLRESFLQMQRMISPWHQWLSPEKYHLHLHEIRALGLQVVASAHGPALRGRQIHSGFNLLEELPYLPPAPLVGQTDFEALLQILAAVPAEADALGVPAHAA